MHTMYLHNININNFVHIQVLPDFQPVKNSTDRLSPQEKGNKDKSSSQEKSSKDKSSSQEKSSKDKSSSQKMGSKEKSSQQSNEIGKHQKDEDVKVLLRDVKVLKQDLKRLEQRIEKLESGDQTCSTPKRTTSSPPLINTIQASVVLSDARDHSCGTLNSNTLNSSGDTYNQDAYDYSYEYEGDNYQDHNNYGGDYRGRSYMGTEFTTSSYTDRRVVEYRGNRRTSHATNFEPGGSYIADYQQSVTIPENSSGSILILKNPEYLTSIKRQSSSMFNFAAKLNCLIFTEE